MLVTLLVIGKAENVIFHTMKFHFPSSQPYLLVVRIHIKKRAALLIPQCLVASGNLHNHDIFPSPFREKSRHGGHKYPLNAQTSEISYKRLLREVYFAGCIIHADSFPY